MPNILTTLRGLSLLREVQPVTIDEAEISKLPKLQQEFILENQKITNVYRIIYRSGNLNVVGYIALPKRLGKKRLPCVIYNRGGSFEFGKITSAFALTRLAQYASWGFVVVASQYRGNDGSDGREGWGGGDLDDVLRLRDILKHLQWADATKIGMVGHSRGGMMTYLALARVKWLKAAVCISAVSDFVRSVRLRPDMKKVAKKAFGTSLSELKKRSAVYWPEKICKTTPILLMHGTADWRVVPNDSLDLSSKFIEQNVPHRLIMLEGGDHGLVDFRKEVAHETLRWLERFVVNGEPLPNVAPHGE